MYSETILDVEDLTITIAGIVVLENLSLKVKERDFLAIIGPNGSGKTTLLKAALGLIPITEGSIKIFGKSPGQACGKVGYLPQNFVFDPEFPIDVFTVVLMSRYRGVFSRTKKEDYQAVERALEKVGMQDHGRRRVGTLSGGETQRVFLARAIVSEPGLLLLDEPTASVDPEMQNNFYDLLDELREKMAIILISHDIGVVFTHVDEVACLNKKLFYHGPTEGAGEIIEEMYNCPIELIAHGVPHRVLHKHR